MINVYVAGAFGCDIKLENAIGCCKLHKYYLTQAQLKTKRCIEKQCKYFKEDCFVICSDEERQDSKNVIFKLVDYEVNDEKA